MTTRTKLSVRNKTFFKKSLSSSCSSSCNMRRETLHKKAYELSILCEADVCIICYARDGELTTWPEDETKVRDIVERFSRLNDRERLKKSTDLSQVLNKKMNDEKKRSLEDNDKNFFGKIMEMEHSLERCLRMLRDKLLPIYSQDQIENRTVSTDLTTSLIVNHQQWTEPSIKTEQDQNRADLSTSSSSLNQPSNFSIFLYNHDTGVFTPMTNSDSLLGAQGFGGLTSCDDIQLPS